MHYLFLVFMYIIQSSIKSFSLFAQKTLKKKSVNYFPRAKNAIKKNKLTLYLTIIFKLRKKIKWNVHHMINFNKF